MIATRSLRTFAHSRRPTCSLAQWMPRRERCFCARPRKLVSRLVGGCRLCAMLFARLFPAPLRVFIVLGKGMGWMRRFASYCRSPVSSYATLPPESTFSQSPPSPQAIAQSKVRLCEPVTICAFPLDMALRAACCPGFFFRVFPLLPASAATLFHRPHTPSSSRSRRCAFVKMRHLRDFFAFSLSALHRPHTPSSSRSFRCAFVKSGSL